MSDSILGKAEVGSSILPGGTISPSTGNTEPHPFPHGSDREQAPNTNAEGGEKRGSGSRSVRIDGRVAHVPLSRGLTAIVDLDDLPSLAQFAWFAAQRVQGVFCACRTTRDRSRQTIYMHREILGAPPGVEVDHINGDTLDNRRANLRTCSRAENVRNRGVFRNNKLGIKGVYQRRGRFAAVIRCDGRGEHLGTFDTAEEAHAAYQARAAELFGSFAHKAARGIT